MLALDLKTPCIEHTQKGWRGYGRTWYQKRVRHSHIAAYLKAGGVIQPGYDLDHVCENRRCVNPLHLQPVTHAENVQRGLQAKLSPVKARAIRARYAKEQNARLAAGYVRVRYGFLVFMAEEFEVSLGTIKSVIGGKSWVAV